MVEQAQLQNKVLSNAVLQAGGHQNQISIDQRNPQRILKKTLKTELNFYESLVHQIETQNQLSGSTTLHEVSPPWSGWRPKFFGFVNTSSDASIVNENEALIILENLTPRLAISNQSEIKLDKVAAENKLEDTEDEDENENERTGQVFKHPNVIDIKLGQRLYDDQATPEKQERMSKAALGTTSAKFGIRLTGAQIWDNVKEEYVEIPKSFGKSIDPSGSDLEPKFNRLFPVSPSVGPVEHRKTEDKIRNESLTYANGSVPADMMKRIIDQSIIPKIQRIVQHLSTFNWRIYGSSILIVFEADQSALEQIFKSSCPEPQIESLSLVKMIDFAHVNLSDSPDPGLLKGLNSVLSLFQQLSLQLKTA